jgi:hypothetical protein
MVGRWRTYGPVGGILSYLSIGNVVVVVGAVDRGDNPEFAVWEDENDLPKPVEKLSTFPHPPWITAEFAKTLGRNGRALRLLFTSLPIIPISPTRFPRIIPKVGWLSPKKGRLSPYGVENDVLYSLHPLVKAMRTYYASAGRQLDQNRAVQLSTAPIIHNRTCTSG